MARRTDTATSPSLRNSPPPAPTARVAQAHCGEFLGRGDAVEDADGHASVAEPVERALEHHFRDLALGGEEIGEFGLGHRVENPQGQVHCEHLALDALEDRGWAAGSSARSASIISTAPVSVSTSCGVESMREREARWSAPGEARRYHVGSRRILVPPSTGGREGGAGRGGGVPQISDAHFR